MGFPWSFRASSPGRYTSHDLREACANEGKTAVDGIMRSSRKERERERERERESESESERESERE